MPTSVPAALPPSAHMPFLPPQRPRLPPEDVQVGAAGEQAGRLAAGSGERPPGLCEQPSGSARDWEADRDTGLSGFGAFFFFLNKFPIFFTLGKNPRDAYDLNRVSAHDA